MTDTSEMEATINQLGDMGFEPTSAKRAAEAAGGHLEGALNWLVAYADSPELEELGLREDGGASTSVPEPVMGFPFNDASTVIHPSGEQASGVFLGVGAECKAVLVCNKQLHMSAGKIGAQCAHAAIGLFREMARKSVPWLPAWEAQGEKMVVLAARSAQDLHTFQEQAARLDLPTYMVQDAGRTEVAPGSETVLAIAGMSEVVDQVTAALPTL